MRHTAFNSVFSSDTPANSVLATAIADIVDRLQAGEPIDLKAICVDTPEMFEELETLLPTLEAIVDFEPSVDADGTLHAGDANSVGGTLGDFRIIREIGRGGMGMVYESEQISLNRHVALKVLPLAATLNPQQLQRFKNEARAAAALKHPHIVSVYSVGTERGVHYYAMELVRGHSLGEVIAELRDPSSTTTSKKGTDHVSATADTSPIAALSTQHMKQPQEYFRQAARLIADAAEALDYAHSQGVIHRDIKPANLLIDDQSHIWVTDFGLAQLGSDTGVTLTGDILGTLRYMSPEQASGKRALVDLRTDLHALGATLFELLTHRCPFETKDRASLLRQVAEQSPPALRQLDPRIPKDLETIVAKAMEKDPSDRYESAAKLASDLRAFAEHRPIAAQPPSLTMKTRKWARRHSRTVAAGVMIVFLAVVGLVVSTLLINHQRSIALRNAQTSKHNADKASDNFQHALTALEQTLAESVAGNLIVQYGDPKHKELASRGIEFYEELARENNVDPGIWPTYRLLVCNQQLDQAYQLKFAHSEEAESAFVKAVSLADRLHNDKKDDPRYLAKLVHCLEEHSVFLHEQGRNNEADVPSRRAAALAEGLLTAHWEFLLVHYLIGINHYNTGVRLWATDRPSEAQDAYQQAIEHLDRAFRLEPTEERNAYGLAQCEYNLAMAYTMCGENDHAEKHWQKSFDFWKGLALMRPLRSEYHSRAGATLSNLAVLARQVEHYQRSRNLAKEALTFQKHALQIEPVYALAKQFMQKHYLELGLALSALRDHEALAAIADEQVINCADSAAAYCNAAMSFGDCIEQLHDDAVYRADGRSQLAIQYSERAFSLLNEASEKFVDNLATFTIGRAYVTLGDGFSQMGWVNEAQQAWTFAEKHFERVRASVPPDGQSDLEQQLKSIRERRKILAQNPI